MSEQDVIELIESIREYERRWLGEPGSFSSDARTRDYAAKNAVLRNLKNATALIGVTS